MHQTTSNTLNAVLSQRVPNQNPWDNEPIPKLQRQELMTQGSDASLNLLCKILDRLDVNRIENSVSQLRHEVVKELVNLQTDQQRGFAQMTNLYQANNAESFHRLNSDEAALSHSERKARESNLFQDDWRQLSNPKKSS